MSRSGFRRTTDRDEDERVREAYGPNYERLVELKAEWDPQNLFRPGSGVEPAVGG